jgi:hypothetical protein
MLFFTKQKQPLAFIINWSYDKKCSRFIRSLFWIHKEKVLAKKCYEKNIEHVSIKIFL